MPDRLTDERLRDVVKRTIEYRHVPFGYEGSAVASDDVIGLMVREAGLMATELLELREEVVKLGTLVAEKNAEVERLDARLVEASDANMAAVNEVGRLRTLVLGTTEQAWQATKNRD